MNEDSKEDLEKDLEAVLDGDDVLDALELTTIVTEACKRNLKVRRPGKKGQKTPVYWWTEEIKEDRISCKKLRRKWTRKQRSGIDSEGMELYRLYKESKKSLKNRIKRSKERCWSQLVDQIEANPWGDAYRIVVDKLARKSFNIPEQQLRVIIDKLFPTHPDPPREEFTIDDALVPEFTIDELIIAAKKLRNRKTPGPDCLTSEITKVVVNAAPLRVLQVMNSVLKTGCFPESWKIARVVLIPKLGKPAGEASSYRPICLLNKFSKLLEHLIRERVHSFLDEREILSARQHGFRQGHSTIMAIQEVMDLVNRAAEKPDSSRLIPCVVTVDVKNAFNSANWGLILSRLQDLDFPPYMRRILQDYLKNRSIIFGAGTKSVTIPVTSGVPQGSVLGPTLWNILYDEILRLKLPKGATTYAYADDLVLVVVGKKIEDVQDIVNDSLRKISIGLDNLCLQPAPHKTEAIMLTGFRRLATPTIVFCDHQIACQNAVKYLGIWLDVRRTFGFHCIKTAEKVNRVCGSLSRILPNVNGPRQAKRKLYASVVIATIAYGLEIWEKALKYQKYRDLINGIIRRIALRTIAAYRTVSSDAAFVISGIPPIEILALERSNIYRGMPNGDARDLRTREWQKMWDSATKASWTRSLIRNVNVWINRNHGEVNYHITQFLTGHGSFGSYFKRFRLRDNDICIYCGLVDTPGHAVFACTEWETERQEVNRKVGRIAVDNIISKMLSKEESWNTIANYIESIIRKKIQDETSGRNTSELGYSEDEEEEDNFVLALEELEENDTEDEEEFVLATTSPDI